MKDIVPIKFEDFYKIATNNGDINYVKQFYEKYNDALKKNYHKFLSLYNDIIEYLKSDSR